MPAEHLRALIHQRRPGQTVRQLTLAANLDLNRIAYYLKPSTKLEQIPKLDSLNDIARAIGCSVAEVTEAFAADCKIPWGPPLDDDRLAAIVRLFRMMGDADKAVLVRLAHALAHPHEPYPHELYEAGPPGGGVDPAPDPTPDP